MVQVARGRSKFSPSGSAGRRGVLGVICGAAVGWLTIGARGVLVGTPALAQEAKPGPPALPGDAPVLRAGQRVRRPFGWIEILTFARTARDEDSEFTIEFLMRNESSEGVNLYPLGNFVRLIADDVPRAPYVASPSDLNAAPESAEYGKVAFRARGRPRVVYVQFGTGESGRSFLRWPD